MTPDIVSIPRAIADIAAQRGDEPCLVTDDATLGWEQFDRAALRRAHLLASVGVRHGDYVSLAADNSSSFFVNTLAVYMVGAIPQPISPRLTEHEQQQIIDLVRPAAVVGFATTVTDGPSRLPRAPVALTMDTNSDSPVDHRPPDAMSPSWKAPTSGGSTGRPKIIVATDPAAINRNGSAGMGMSKGGTMLIPGPMYHNAPFSYAVRGLAFGNALVTTARFDPRRTLELCERHRADWMLLVPTMMQRIWRLEERDRFDISSLVCVWHVASICPPWLKQAWIDWLGPDRLFELYAGTEAQAVTAISGREWLAHRGSVGRAVLGEITIRRPDRSPAAPGETGEIFMRSAPGRRSYVYLGAQPKSIAGGWESLGDLGHMDADGYVYITDRLADMVISGGANIYPAEVELAIEEHPDVVSAAVVGIPDDDLGSILHATVQLASGASLAVDELAAFLGQRLVRYKHPRSWSLTHDTVRDDAGKVRRSEVGRSVT